MIGQKRKFEKNGKTQQKGDEKQYSGEREGNLLMREKTRMEKD